jgi:hypothetical protein
LSTLVKSELSWGMPSFGSHIYASAAVGAAGAALGVIYADFDSPTAVLAMVAGFAGGMVPDLDADRGRPLRIAGGLVSLALAGGTAYTLLSRPMPESSILTPTNILLIGLGLLFLFNTVGLEAFRRLTRHRGMFHSLPAALAFGALLAALFAALGTEKALILSVAGVAGVMSHLVLDAIFTPTLMVFKWWSKSTLSAVTAWCCALGLTAWAWQALS